MKRGEVRGVASMLAGRLGYSGFVLQTGSRAAGVSWHVTFYRGDPKTTAPDRTIRLGFTAAESRELLAAMVAGIDLYRDATR